MRALLLCIALFLSSAAPAFATEVLVLQSSRSPGYVEALRGFRAGYKGPQRTVVLSDFAEVDVDRMVKEERPRLLVALGDKALSAARSVRDVPVLALLALSQGARPTADNIGGVAMAAPPEHYLKLMASMGIRRCGVLYDPSKTGRYLRRAEQEARQHGVTLVAEPVGSPRDTQARLDRLKGKVDALWMLPDATVFTTVNLEAFILFSMTNQVPVLTFSSYYLKNGAAASVDIDYFDIGSQAAEMALSLLNSGVTGKVPTADPRKTHLRLNESVIRKLGLQPL